MSDLKAKTKSLMKRLFPERQLYLRANGHVRLLTFSPRHQIIASAVALCFFCWVGVTSVHFLDRDAALAAKEKRLEDMMRSYQALDAELRQMQQGVVETARRLDARQDLLNAALHDGDKPGAAVEIPIPGPQASLTPTKPRSTGMFSWLTGATEDNPSSLASIEANLAGIEARQKTIAERMVILTDSTLGSYDKVLRQTGISKDRLLKVAAVETTLDKTVKGSGGPFVTMDDAIHNLANISEQDDPVARLLSRRMELKAIDAILAHTPFIPPITVAEISSGFGGRHDPFNGHGAMHGGIDLLPKDLNKPILIQAPGIVKKAGWNGPYGQFVEVDHGNGFVTRYGHMRKILVTAGEKLTLNSPIGYVGSTGRSTGPHLHYEIWFGGRPLNPLNFFKIAEDIQNLRQSAASQAHGVKA
ncbi:peptidoglycan DD-metalloendopeptidase family protein [Govanella unica]|uniref:M23 family metallopeptidase n=1 Tax=Govanella unica TaxID=2975056 RepID=A0A9X3Z6W5_9PROT|nr:M23 family metallopeptidase [Govania unica]